MKKIYEYIKDVTLFLFLSYLLKDSKRVLDVGCGENSPIRNVIGNFYLEGVDIDLKTLKRTKYKKIHHKYKEGNILKLRNLYKPKSFDSVIALDVIEHFKKEDAIRLLRSLELIAKDQVIIFTPRGFMKQGIVNGNRFQVHRSGWKAREFRKFGYKVYGLRGLHKLRNLDMKPKLRPFVLGGLLVVLSEPFFLFLPDLTFHLLAVKKLKK